MSTRHFLLWGFCSAALTACSPASDDSDPSRNGEDSARYTQEQPYHGLVADDNGRAGDQERTRDSDPDNDSEERSDPQTTDIRQSDCQLTIGFDIWEPYQFIDIGEQDRGLDIDIAEATAELMGCELEFQQATWVDLLYDMQSGDVDLLMGASKTAERETYAYFSQGYRDEHFVLFVREEDQRQYSDMSLIDILESDKRIGIVDSYYYGDEFQEYYIQRRDDDSGNGAEFVSAMMGEFNLVRLLDHDIDGFLEDRVVGHSLIRRKGLSEYIAPADIELSSGSVYVMFSKESTDEDLVETFNQALDELRESGEYEQIMSRYLQ